MGIVLTFVWFCLSIFETKTVNYRVVCFLCGALFADITCRLIICQMSNQPPRWEHYLNVFLVFCGVGVILQIFNRFLVSNFAEDYIITDITLWIWIIITVVIN